MHTALQYRSHCFLSESFDLLELDSLSSHWSSVLDVFMTRSTEDERLALESYHSLDPFWFWPSWVLMQVFHCPYMMDFYFICAAAHFAGICKEPLYEF